MKIDYLIVNGFTWVEDGRPSSTKDSTVRWTAYWLMKQNSKLGENWLSGCRQFYLSREWKTIKYQGFYCSMNCLWNKVIKQKLFKDSLKEKPYLIYCWLPLKTNKILNRKLSDVFWVGVGSISEENYKTWMKKRQHRKLELPAAFGLSAPVSVIELDCSDYPRDPIANLQ